MRTLSCKIEGVNLCACGCGQPVKSKWRQGHNPKNQGRRFTDEHRKRLSEANTGKQAGELHRCWGKPLLEETRRKIGEANRGKTRSLEARQKISETKRQRYGLSASPSAIHLWLNRWYPKSGICDACGKFGRTDYASLTGHDYTRNREDYAELCPSCHLTLDYAQDIRRKRKKRGQSSPGQ